MQYIRNITFAIMGIIFLTHIKFSLLYVYTNVQRKIDFFFLKSLCYIITYSVSYIREEANKIFNFDILYYYFQLYNKLCYYGEISTLTRR